MAEAAVPRAVPPEVPDGAVLFPLAPGVVPMYFVWKVGGLRPLPYKMYDVLAHVFCMAKHLPCSKS